mmetsp:Transcript_2494/g.4646  ORF Transcript_2494/g.4646 Transcript_2494/m.4646 type:complete len:290 (+) Transcript_2494:221-1090(+)
MVHDHRGPGDYTRTLTKKVQSLSPAEDVSSLSLDEQRQRPVPPSSASSQNGQQHATLNDRTGDMNIRQKKSQPTTVASSPSTTDGDEPASLSDDGQWWTEKTQRPQHIHSAGDSLSNNAKVLNRAVDGTHKQAIKASSAPEPHQPSAMQSLLKDEKQSVSGRNATAIKPPIAAMQPSAMQSLLKDERPIVGIKEYTINSPRAAAKARTTSSPLSSLLQDDHHAKSQKNKRSPTLELEWWNEKPKRPRGYVKHFQPIKTSYVKKFEPPRDYGDVVTATNAQMVYPRRRRT